MTWRGRVEWVESTTPRGFLASDQALGTTSLPIYGADSFVSSTNTGSVVIDATTYAYTSVTVSADESVTPSTLVISPGLVQDEINGEPIELVSADETKYAGVSTGDGIGDVMRVRVPHGLKSYSALTDGVRGPDERETVDVERRNGELVIVNVIGIADMFDASTTPIVTATDGGNRVQIDGDGISTFSQFAPLDSADTTGPVGLLIDGGTIVVSRHDSGAYLTVLDLGLNTISGTGALSAGSAYGPIATDSTDQVWIANGTSIYPYSRSGVSGFSITTVGSVAVAIDSTDKLFSVDGTNDLIRPYSLSGSAGSTFSAPGAVDIFIDTADKLYVLDATSNLVRMFSNAGVAAGTFSTIGIPVCVAVGPATGNVHVVDTTNTVRIFDPAGTLLTSFDLGTVTPSDIALDFAEYIYVVDPAHDAIFKYNILGAEVTTTRIDSQTGQLSAYGADIRGSLGVDYIGSRYLLSLSGQSGVSITGPTVTVNANTRINGTLMATSKMQAGTGVVATTAAATQSVAVVFPKAFLTAPKVNVDVISTTPNLFQTSHSAATTTGFTIYLYRASGSGNVSVDWQAIVS